jgi:hypothetical protein
MTSPSLSAPPPLRVRATAARAFLLSIVAAAVALAALLGVHVLGPNLSAAHPRAAAEPSAAPAVAPCACCPKEPARLRP